MPQTMFPGIRLFLLLALEGSSGKELVEKPESSTNAVPAVTKKKEYIHDQVWEVIWSRNRNKRDPNWIGILGTIIYLRDQLSKPSRLDKTLQWLKMGR